MHPRPIFGSFLNSSSAPPPLPSSPLTSQTFHAFMTRAAHPAREPANWIFFSLPLTSNVIPPSVWANLLSPSQPPSELFLTLVWIPANVSLFSAAVLYLSFGEMDHLTVMSLLLPGGKKLSLIAPLVVRGVITVFWFFFFFLNHLHFYV